MKRNCGITSKVGRMGKISLIVVIAISVLLSATGCKGRGEVQSGEVDQGARTEDLNIKGNITVTIMNESGTEKEGMAINAAASSFMQDYPGTRVVVEEINNDKYPALISSGDIGDVFWTAEYDATVYKTDHNALMPLDAYIKPLGIDTLNVYSGALKAGMIDGRLYMAPRKLGQQLLIFNRSATSEAGIEVPLDRAMTWDEFKDICRRLTVDTDGDGKIDQVGAALKVWWTTHWIAFFEGWGGKWIDSENKVVSLVSDPLVLKGITEMIDALKEGWLYPEDMQYTSGYANLSPTNYVFRTFGAFTWLTRYGNEYDAAKLDWDFCPFPAFPVHKVCAGSTGYVVYSRTDNPDTAAAFALYFLTENGQRAYHSQTGGSTPLLKTLAQEDFWRAKGTDWEDKNYDAFISYPDATTAATVIVQAPKAIADILSNDVMTQILSRILNTGADPISLFTELETRANEKWATLI